MMKASLLAIAVIYILHGLFMLIMPHLWYDTIPGVPTLGPYNTHFIRDVGIVYLVSGFGFAWGLRGRLSGMLLLASVWPALHAIYHLQMWVARGFAFDLVALVNILGIQAPAWLGLWIVMKLEKDFRS